MFKIVIFSTSILAAVLAVVIFSGAVPLTGSKKQASGTVTVWGTFPQNEMDTFFQQYNTAVKDWQVTYRFIKEDAFSETLVEALANGAGPDAILAPYQIILEQSSRVFPLPKTSFPEKTYRDIYVDGASIFLGAQGMLALPVTIEPMVLFFNRTLLSKHGISLPPAHWGELNDITEKLTVTSSQGGFTESAIALGSYGNTPHVKDLLATMVAQLKQDLVAKTVYEDGRTTFQVTANNPLVSGGDVFPLSAAVRFFMEFSDPSKSKYTWNQFQPNAQDQFVAEKLALYIGYFAEGKTIKARNPRLDFDVTILPQAKDYNTFVTGMKMHGVSILQASKNPVAAFQVQSDLASFGWASQLSSLVGAVPPHRSYTLQEGVSEVLKRSNLIARGWYDVKPKTSSEFVSRMITDITNGRVDISQAVQAFVTRLQDLYTAR